MVQIEIPNRFKESFLEFLQQGEDYLSHDSSLDDILCQDGFKTFLDKIKEKLQ